MKFLSAMLVVFLVLTVHSAPIKLYCWIVQDDGGRSPHSETTLTNHLATVNRIYSQVAMRFSIESISYTNSTRLTAVNYTNDVQNAELCALGHVTDGLEVYFVNSITHNVTAFQWSHGIVVGDRANGTTLAHEIGHACGLSDIYDVFPDETSLAVVGNPERNRFTHDWGWYPENLTHADIVKKLLMYGYGSDTKGDISRGDVYGLWYHHADGTTNKVWQLGLAPVGFKLHGNRHPVSD